MKTVEKVSDYLNIEEIFNPQITFQGSFAIDSLVFLETAKKSKGVNLFEKFLTDHYFNRINECIRRKNLRNPHLFLCSGGDNGYGRKLTASLSLFLMEYCYRLVGETPEISEEFDEMQNEVRELSRKYRKDIAAILRGEITEERKGIYQFLCEEYEMIEKNRGKAYGANYIPPSFESFLEAKKDAFVALSFGLKSLMEIFNKPIDLNELAECLDLDKFYLAMMKQLVEVTELAVRTDGKVHNSFVIVVAYVNLVEKLRRTGKYDLTVETYLFDRTKIKYSVDDLIREYNEIRLKNPEFKVVEVEAHDEDYRDLAKAKEFSHQLGDYFASKELQASWNFIRNGRKDTDGLTSVGIEARERLSQETGKRAKKSRDELIKETNDRIEFLDSTPYLYKMKGKNNFEGYIGYIYANGSVIFEKFYKSEDSLEPALENATYVMSFVNFVEMSKRTKTEIMKFIREGESDLRRVYHTSTWCDRISKIIEGKSYNEEAMERIERLINENQIVRKK